METCQTVNIWTENITEILKWFLPLNSSITYETNKNPCTNFFFKKLRTHVPTRYLTIF
jgi:hypothetical protein